MRTMITCVLFAALISSFVAISPTWGDPPAIKIPQFHPIVAKATLYDEEGAAVGLVIANVEVIESGIGIESYHFEARVIIRNAEPETVYSGTVVVSLESDPCSVAANLQFETNAAGAGQGVTGLCGHGPCLIKIGNYIRCELESETGNIIDSGGNVQF